MPKPVVVALSILPRAAKERRPTVGLHLYADATPIPEFLDTIVDRLRIIS